MDIIIMVVTNSEGENIEDINLLDELLNGNVDFYKDINELIESDTDYSECATFVLSVTDFGTVLNNPKFISQNVEKKAKPKKK